MEDLLNELEHFNFPKIKRKNISTETYQTALFGKVHRQFTSYIGPSKLTLENSILWEKIKIYAKLIDPNFLWTTCNINKNVKSNPHYDKKNFGNTMIIGLGDYTGGELNINGNKININNNPYYFNGSKNLHWTEDFQGIRYSLMFYNYHFDAVLLRPNTTDNKCFKEISSNNYMKHGISYKPGDTWLDLGCNIGLFARRTRMFGCYIIGVEPDIENWKIAVQNDDYSKIYNAAVTADKNKKNIDLWIGNSQWNYTTYKPIRGRKKIQVPTIWFGELINQVDCIKMDIEGEELNILDGDFDLSNIQQLVIAYHCNYDSDRQHLLDRIKKLEKYFVVVHSKFPNTDKINIFPNEIMLYCIKNTK